MVCTGSYAVTQADVDAGSVTNVATASDGTTTSLPDSVTVPGNQDPALMLLKQAAGITVNGTRHTDLAVQYFVVGAVVDYTSTTANTGNITITNSVTADDVALTSVTNLASATAPQLRRW